ncbi:YbaB/EbfC family nucleoid-associated protein [Actinomadura sp. NEAU-AAG7]|uniref:YbaB/EbfC family nucleoid-associated protein n=1 Tax=Actinomadura sp. NEAU-AAG7 TaxID=2839640 RepID=UPI001BE4B7B4|nr:YbaB/EbfC family nucleoid-associated protein [Actinomadura sp. NEAU-AAG7]MBT2212979.1 YbaB/EbfC family nucleoid-associated protein [Actinomadura sp. NEAU-AAG7]
MYDESEQAHRLRELILEVVQRPFVATSADKMIKVTAVASGQVVGLEIDPKIYRNPNSAGLARNILETLNRAISGAAGMHLESLQQITGNDSFGQLMQGATDLVSELIDEADDFRRGSHGA